MKYYQVFGRNSCPWCAKAAEVLESGQYDFMMCDMEKSPALLQHYKDSYNMRTVPIILEIDLFEDDVKVIGGCSELIDYLGGKNESE